MACKNCCIIFYDRITLALYAAFKYIKDLKMDGENPLLKDTFLCMKTVVRLIIIID